MVNQNRTNNNRFMSCVLFSQLGYRPKYIFSIFSSCGEIPGKYMHIAYTSFIQNYSYHGNGYCHSTVVLKDQLAIFTKPIRIQDFRLWQQLWKCYYHQTNQHQCNNNTDQSQQILLPQYCVNKIHFC